MNLDAEYTKLLECADAMGLNRKEAVIIFGTMFVNHAIAEELDPERCRAVVTGLFHFRADNPLSNRSLVKVKS